MAEMILRNAVTVIGLLHTPTIPLPVMLPVIRKSVTIPSTYDGYLMVLKAVVAIWL